MKSDSNHIISTWIILVVFVMLYLTIVWTVPKINVTSDSQDYLVLSNTIVEDGSFSRFGRAETYRTPAYPFFISFFINIFGGNSFRMVASAQAVLYALQAVMVFRICLCLWGIRAGVVAVCLLLLNAGSKLSVISILTETLFSTLLISLVWIWVCCWRDKPVCKYGCIGIVLGALTLVRPVTQYLWVFIALILCFSKTNIKINKMNIIGSFLVGILMTQGLWALRNYSYYQSLYISEISSALLYIPWAQTIKAKVSNESIDVLLDTAWRELDEEQPVLLPLEMKEKYTKKALDIIIPNLSVVPVLWFEGALRQVYESAWMKLLNVYFTDIPLTVSQQVAHINSGVGIVLVYSIIPIHQKHYNESIKYVNILLIIYPERHISPVRHGLPAAGCTASA